MNNLPDDRYIILSVNGNIETLLNAIAARNKTSRQEIIGQLLAKHLPDLEPK